MIKRGNDSIKNMRIPFGEIISKFGLRRAIVYYVIALFFAILIFTYNYYLSSYFRQSIQQRIELNALDSSREVDIYLSTGADIIGIVEHVVDDMISKNATDDEILEYLTVETEHIQNSIMPASTGIYGCIRGKYFDGSGWDPGADYVPQERPWYIEATDDVGNLVLINPYFDLFSKEVVMTIAKSLPDGENVVAVDITLGRIQEITTREMGGDSEIIKMVISANGMVVAHSDPDEIGHYYLNEKGTLGNLALTGVQDSPNGYCEVEYKRQDYSVYGVPIGDGWYSISIVNAEKEDNLLRSLFAASVFAIIATFIIFTVIMLRTGRSAVINDNLQAILNSSADIYMSLCDLDLINNSVTEIKNVNPAIAQAVENCNGNMKELFGGIMKGLPESSTKQAAIAFTDLSNVDQRFKNRNTAMLEYLSFGDVWVRARLIVSERTPEGKVAHILWLLENIDEEKKERERLIDVSERAVAASEAKSSFLSNMSHEIRTPINSILGMNEVIYRECEDEKIRGYSRNIMSSGHTLLEIVNDILDISKIESGKMDIIPTDYDLASVLNDLVNMISSRIESKGLKLILNIDENIPQKLHGDDMRLRQIITNILTNAVKYTEQGSITFSVSFDKVPEAEDKIVLHVSVKDTGIGIKREDMNRLFSEFERIDEKRNRNIEGTGLGMAITRKLLNLMNSRLIVNSIYGEGSEFSFDVEQDVISWNAIGDYEAAYELAQNSIDIYHGNFTAPTANILVVDDTETNLLVFTGLLEPTKIQIDTASNGDDGIRLAADRKYDIIFLDHMMAGKDGIETLHDIRSNRNGLNHDTPAICLTANAIAGAKEQYIEAGFDDYLSKPVNFKSLEEMIVRYLDRDKIIQLTVM